LSIENANRSTSFQRHILSEIFIDNDSTLWTRARLRIFCVIARRAVVPCYL